MKIKIILIVLIVYLINLNLSAEIDRNEWNKLSDKEKFEYYNLAVSELEICAKRLEITNNELIKTNAILEKKEIKYGFSMFALAGLDKDLEVDCYAGIIFNRFLFSGKAYVGAGGSIKLYNIIGGSIVINVGFSW